MMVKCPIDKTFDFFDLDLTVDDVSFTIDNGPFDPQRFEIEAHVRSGKTFKSLNENPFDIKRVIFNGPATIVFWLDGTKTVVKCAEGETNDKKASILWAYAKKICGTSSHMNKVLDKLVSE